MPTNGGGAKINTKSRQKILKNFVDPWAAGKEFKRLFYKSFY